MPNLDSPQTPSVSTPTPKLLWLLAFVAELALILGAFWSLLGYRYSPETYDTEKIDPGNVELAWFGVGCVGVIFAVAWVRRQFEICRAFFWAFLPLAIVSVVALVKAWLGKPMRSYDAILFCCACGWGVLLARNKKEPSSPLESTRPATNALLVPIALCAALVGLGTYFFHQQVWYWNNLALGFSDVGEIARQMHNSIHHPHELFMALTPERKMFWDHFYPGVLPFVPLWAVWPSLKLLIVFQLVCVLGTAVPIYWLGQHFFKDRIAALLLALGWLVYPSTSQLIYKASYGFAWGNFCLPLYFVALVLWLKDRNGWALAVAVWTLLIKEEAAIILGMFGLYLALFQRPRWRGVAMAVVAFGYFFVVTSVVLPALNEGKYLAENYFSQLGATKMEIVLAPFTKPAVFWGKLFEPTTFYFAAVLLAPLLFLPLKKPSVLFIGSLTFLFVSLWNNPMAKSICFQYQAGLLPVIFWALACVLTTDSEQEKLTPRSALAGVIVAGAMLSIFLGNTFWSKSTLPVDIAPGRIELVRKFAAQIDPKGTLVTTQRLASHFINQNYLYLAPQLPPETDSVLIDLRSRWRPTPGLDWLRVLREFQRKVESRSDLHLIDAEDGLILYARSGSPLDARAAVERNALPPEASPTEMDLGQGVKIAGFVAAPESSQTKDRMVRVHVIAFSTAMYPTPADLAAKCTLQFRVGTSEEEAFATTFQPLGQGIWTTTKWSPGNIYVDDFVLTVPAEFAKEKFAIRFVAEDLNLSR